MPSYAYLFRDSRGDDLVNYLQSLNTGDTVTAARAWTPSETAGDPVAGESVFLSHCATCHSDGGYVRNTWRTSFRRLPPDLRTGPFVHLDPIGSVAAQIAGIVKFGIHGTDMPGHEYLPDREIAAVSLWLAQVLSPRERPAPASGKSAP
jgi:cytochrome c oxidase cbb3-type subunit 2